MNQKNKVKLVLYGTNLESLDDDLEIASIRAVRPRMMPHTQIIPLQPKKKTITQKNVKQEIYDIEQPQLKNKIRNRSFEKRSNTFAYFATGLNISEKQLQRQKITPLGLFKKNFHQINENEKINSRKRKLMALEKHKGNKGHKHNYYFNNDKPSDPCTCAICGDSYGKHQESLAVFKQGLYFKKPLLKSVHSFHDFELLKLNRINEEGHTLDFRIRQANKNILKSGNHTFSCDICYSEAEKSNITFLECGHYFCKQCLTDYYKYMVNVAGQVQKIKCPNVSCLKQIKQKNIQDQLDPNSYEKFQKFMKNYEVQTDPSKKFCPFPGCEEVVVGRIGQKEATCTKCNRKLCFTCQIPWHKGKSCKQALDEQYKGWAVEINAHKCPKCQVPIEKNSGCSHMTCSSCGHYFCWLCGMPVRHWVHTNDKFNPFSCKYTHKFAGRWSLLFLTFLLGFIFIPFILFGLPVIGMMYLVIVMISSCCSCTRKMEDIWCCIGWIFLIPFTLISFILGFCFSLAAGAIAVGILTPFVYILHIFFFVRTIYWWSKNKIKV